MSAIDRRSFRIAAACGIALIAILAAGLLRAQMPRVEAPPVHAQHHIIIRILEAHSGKPVKDEKLGVWLEHGVVGPKTPTDAPAFWTDKQGNAAVPLDSNPYMDTISIWVLGDIPCEPFNHIDFKLDYSIDKILTRGVVSDNVCGKARHVPVPGVLIIFVKHRPWWAIGDLLTASSRSIAARAAYPR